MDNDLPDFGLETYLPYQFTVLAARLSDQLAKQYRSKFDISIAEWRVLVNVGYSDDLSVRDIERRVSLEKSIVSRAASKLEARGFLVKHIDNGDRRLLKLSLTPKGSTLLKDLIPIAQSYQNDLDDILGSNRAQLSQALDILMERTK